MKFAGNALTLLLLRCFQRIAKLPQFSMGPFEFCACLVAFSNVAHHSLNGVLADVLDTAYGDLNEANFAIEPDNFALYHR